MTGKIRGVLFDKDGTLVDYAKTWEPAYRAAAEELADAAGAPGLARRLLIMGGYDGDGVLDPGSVLACGTNAEITALWSGTLSVNAAPAWRSASPSSDPPRGAVSGPTVSSASLNAR